MKLKKILAAVVASAVAVSAMVVTVAADATVAFSASKAVQSTGGWWDQTDLTMAEFIGDTDPAAVTKVVVSVDKAASFTYNGATAGGYTKVDLTDGGSVEVTDIWLDDNFFVGLAVSSGDTAYASTFTWDVYAEGGAATTEEAPAEETTEEAPAEEAPAEETTEEAPAEEVEEAPVEEEAEEVAEEVEETPAATSSAAGTANDWMVDGDANGTVFVLADKETDPNWSADTGIATTDVYGVKYYVEFNADEVAVPETWIGGGIGANSQSTGWLSNEWGRADKAIIADLENGTITWLSDAPVFAADDTYCQFWLQTWGGTVTIKGADILGADGVVLGTSSEAPVETAPEADASTEAVATGNVAVASIAAVMALAGAAALVSKKRN